MSDQEIVDLGLVETYAHVTQNVADYPKLIVMREWRTTTGYVRDVFETVAPRHAEAAETDLRRLLAWCGLPADILVDLAMSEHASFVKPHVFTRAFVRLANLVPAEAQCALNDQMEAAGGGLRGTIERALA